MENGIGHRRLPPQRTGLATSQASIVRAVVPEVSLVWEGEESVYWRPNSPCPRPAMQASSAPMTSSSTVPTMTARPAILPSRWPRPNTAVNESHRPLMQQPSFSQKTSTGILRGMNQAARFQSSASSQAQQGVLKESPMYHENRPMLGNTSNRQYLEALVDTHSSDCLHPPTISSVGTSDMISDEHLEQQISVSTSSKSHYNNSPPENTRDALARLMQAGEYNPSVYSSGGRTIQTANMDHRRHTPLLRKDPKSIIPRAMDFNENATPPSEDRVLRREDKENISPNSNHVSGNSQRNLTSSSDVILRQSVEQQIVPYKISENNSPQMQISSPAEPYLCKMIDRKDQQIFQLHKVLETVLSKTEGNCSTNSLPSSEIPLKRTAETQTSLCHTNKPELRTVGVNTDITWSELLKSVREECNTPTKQRSVTILKNSNLRRSASATVLQKGSNTSSVRFDTCHQMMEAGEHITEVHGEKKVAGTKRDDHQHCHCYECVASKQAITDSKNVLQENGDPRNRGNVCTDSQVDGRERSSPQRRNNLPLGERTSGPAEPTSHYSGNNHREVSLTLRELVLTTIHEDPISPQPSLHLDLPEYRGDTIHQQLPPNRQPSSPPASRRVAPLRQLQDSKDHWTQRGPSTPRLSHRGSPSTGAGRGRLCPVTAAGSTSAAPRHYSTPQYTPPAHRGFSNQRDDGQRQTLSPASNGSRRHDNDARGAGADNGRRDRDEAENQARGDTGEGVTIYRNLVNNLQQILEPPSNRQTLPDGRQQQYGSDTAGLANEAGTNNDQHMDVLQQQLRHFGLSFLERKPVQDVFSRTGGNFPHSSPPPADMYCNNPQPAQHHDNKSPVDFSIATVEFLRQNGLLNTE